jgi:hypothetical protein
MISISARKSAQQLIPVLILLNRHSYRNNQLKHYIGIHMAFLILFSFCWIVSQLLMRRLIPNGFYARHKNSIFWGRIALFSILMLLIGTWREWELTNWISGRVTRGVDITESVVVLFMLSLILCIVFVIVERKD